jgi:hypothetical protein
MEKTLKAQRFTWHNSEWLGMITAGVNEFEERGDSTSPVRFDSPFDDDDDPYPSGYRIGASGALLFGL